MGQRKNRYKYKNRSIVTAVCDGLSYIAPEMDTSWKIFFLFFLSVCRMPEASCKNNKLKIIVPHKISVIHHHHSKMTDIKPKKKLHIGLHEILKPNQIHHQEEESEEVASEESHFGHFLGPDEDTEASQKGIAYYAIPAAEYSTPVRVYRKPILMYNDFYERRNPPRYEYFRYEDYSYPERYQEDRYHIKGFEYK